MMLLLRLRRLLSKEIVYPSLATTSTVYPASARVSLKAGPSCLTSSSTRPDQQPYSGMPTQS